ncbi:MAG: hypothetical protein D6798_17925 [Deltaproteobacteria bacterium]|nr:MAG: hypothetical protein D6798_17925 [Deltaproteobacteria bacterium]
MVFDALPLDGSAVPLSDAQLTVHGTDAGALMGYSAAGGWGLDGDGRTDLALSAHGDDTRGANSGSACIFFGRRG